MEYKVNFNIETFQFWGGAKDRVKDLTYKQLKKLGDYIEDTLSYCEDIVTEIQINDFVQFECDDFLDELTKEEI